MIDDAQYKKFFEGYRIKDVTIYNQKSFHFWLVGKKNPNSRIISMTLNDGGYNLKKTVVKGFDKDDSYIEIAYPEEIPIVMDFNSRYIIPSKDNKTYNNITSRGRGGLLGAGIQKLRSFNKEETWVISHSGDLLVREVRDDNKKWTRVAPPIDEAFPDARISIRDVDAFSPDDIYAADEEGLYHYNGEAWKKIDYIRNKYIGVICCAEDGFVYLVEVISLVHIAIYKGRDEQWEKIFEKRDPDSRHDQWQDIVWFDGKVWASTWSTLMILENDKYIYDHDAPSGGHLCVRDGTMLCAGESSAHMYKPSVGWTTLVKSKPN